MQMISVSSSAIAAVGYDPITMRLRIQFTSDRQFYDFCGVPAHIYQGLMAAGSKGTYYSNNIRDRYRC